MQLGWVILLQMVLVGITNYIQLRVGLAQIRARASITCLVNHCFSKRPIHLASLAVSLWTCYVEAEFKRTHAEVLQAVLGAPAHHFNCILLVKASHKYRLSKKGVQIDSAF